MVTGNLCFAWTGDFNSLKKFVAETLMLDGQWMQPGGDKKLFTFDTSSIVWRKNKNLLSVEGEQSSCVKKKICEVMLSESLLLPDSPLKSQSNVNDAIVNDIESLKSGQRINSEAIQSLAESICQINSIISDAQKNTEINSKVSTETSLANCTDKTSEHTEYANLDINEIAIVTKQLGHSCENKKDDCNGLIKEMNSTKCVNPDIIEIEVNDCNPKNSSEDNPKASHDTGLNLVEWQLEEYKKQQKKIPNINRATRMNKSNQLQNIFKRETKQPQKNKQPRRPYEKYAPKPSRIPQNQQNDKRYLVRKHENQQQTKNQQCYKYGVQNRFRKNVASREDKP